MTPLLTAAAAGSRRWDIVGIGDVDVDMFLAVPVLAGRDEKVPATLIGEHPGGMIANVTCAASALGASTAMIGLVGDDAYGRTARSGLQDFGVDVSMLRTVTGGRTFYCVIMLDESGEKALTAVKTECHWPQRDDIDPDRLSDTRVVHTSGDYLEMTIWLAEQAQAHGTLVSLDLEASTAVHGLPALRPLLAATDVLFMNHAGYNLLDDDPVRAIKMAHDLGPAVVVITLGSAGAITSAAGRVVSIDARPAPVVDTTGAGDCFIGAFLSALLAGSNLDHASRYAVAAASASISSVGSRTSMPDHDAVLALLSTPTVHLPSQGER